MKQNLSAISNYLTNLFRKTNQLEELEKRVNEMIMDDIIKDFTLHKSHKEISGDYYVYEVKEDDFEHIVEYLKPIQDTILPDLVIMAQKTKDDCKILFKVNQRQTDERRNINYYFERRAK